MCECKNIEIGSYGNVECIEHNGKKIGIDKCLVEEIKELWSKGIETTGHCCGHNKRIGYIGVEKQDIPVMLVLGYSVRLNNLDITRMDSFIPKSIIYNREAWANMIESMR